MHLGDARVERFLDDEPRQVWARDRNTGEAIFLEVGQATAVRSTARREWRCPYPECVGEITTRGGVRRDHFLHLGPTPHQSDGETENHLGAKAMFARWLTEFLPDHEVVEEQSVKDPGNRVARRADVMVALGQLRHAIEVEYKAFAVEAWRKKDDEYLDLGVSCTWVLGHTRIKMEGAGVARAVSDQAVRVRVPALAGVWAGRGRHVFVVNPVTRQVGTLAGDPAFRRGISAGTPAAWMRVCALDECSFSVHGGLETPASKEIDAHLRAAEVERQRLEAERAARAEAEASQREEEAIRRQVRAAEWEHSELRKELAVRWTRLPQVLAATPEYAFLIDADPRMWKSVIYEALVHGRGPRERFAIEDCVRVLHEVSIAPLESFDSARRVIELYLRELEAARSVVVGLGPGGLIHKVRPVRDLLGADEEDERARQRQILADRLAGERRRQEQARWAAEVAVRQRERANAQAGRTSAWRETVWFKCVIETWGHVPGAIEWDDLIATESVTGPHQVWHAAIWLDLIVGRANSSFTITNAVACVERCGAEVCGDRGLQKVADYLTNMIQRGVLDGPRELNEVLAGGTYFVREGPHQPVVNPRETR